MQEPWSPAERSHSARRAIRPANGVPPEWLQKGAFLYSLCLGKKNEVCKVKAICGLKENTPIPVPVGKALYPRELFSKADLGISG